VELADIAWAANLGTVTFHPWPVRRADVDHPDELRIDLDPQPGTDFDDAKKVALGPVHEILGELGFTGFPKTSGNRGVHVYLRVEPRWTFTEVRRSALAFAREVERRMPDLVHHGLVEGGARREGLHRLQPERARPHHRVGLQRPAEAARSRLRAGDLGRAADVETDDFTIATMPERFAKLGDVHATIDDQAFSLEPLLEWADHDERDHGLGDMPYPPNYPKMEGEPKRVQPSRAKPMTS